jgi:hypothetical protein
MTAVFDVAMQDPDSQRRTAKSDTTPQELRATPGRQRLPAANQLAQRAITFARDGGQPGLS